MDKRSMALSIASLGALGAQAVSAPVAPVEVDVAIGCVAVALAIAGRRASAAAGAIGALTALLAVLFPISLLPWQATMALALGIYALLARLDPALAPAAGWARRGSVPLMPTAIVAGVTPFALAGWLVVARPDLSDALRAYVPDLPLAALIAGGVAFALLNASLEELIWRGVLHDRLEAIASPAPIEERSEAMPGRRLPPSRSAVAVIALTSISFGVQHAHGVPRGFIGALLAGVWAVMLAWLRRRARGLAAPVVAHVVADATIAVIMLTLASAGEG